MHRLTSAIMTSLKRVPIPARGVDYRGKIVLGESSCTDDILLSFRKLILTLKMIPAPMVRSGEMPSRLLALHYGADLVWGKKFLVLLSSTLSSHTW